MACCFPLLPVTTRCKAGKAVRRAPGRESGRDARAFPGILTVKHLPPHLPAAGGVGGQIAEIIAATPEFKQDLDWSARPGTKTYPRWKDALVGCFKQGRYPHLFKNASKVNGYNIYYLDENKMVRSPVCSPRFLFLLVRFLPDPCFRPELPPFHHPPLHLRTPPTARVWAYRAAAPCLSVL